MAAIFVVDEKVLAYHGPLLYHAKVLEVKSAGDEGFDGDVAYKLHYLGWSPK